MSCWFVAEVGRSLLSTPSTKRVLGSWKGHLADVRFNHGNQEGKGWGLGGAMSSFGADASSHNVLRKETRVPLDILENHGFYEEEGLVPAVWPEHIALRGEYRELTSCPVAAPPLCHMSAWLHCKKKKKKCFFISVFGHLLEERSLMACGCQEDH